MSQFEYKQTLKEIILFWTGFVEANCWEKLLTKGAFRLLQLWIILNRWKGNYFVIFFGRQKIAFVVTSSKREKTFSQTIGLNDFRSTTYYEISTLLNT